MSTCLCSLDRHAVNHPPCCHFRACHCLDLREHFHSCGVDGVNMPCRISERMADGSDVFLERYLHECPYTW